MRYKLVIWDFDGTLAETLHVALEIYNRLATEKGYQQIDDPHAVRDMGMRKFLSTHGVPIYKVPTLFATFLKEIRKRSGDIGLNDGIADVVSGIATAGARQCVVSSNDTRTIRDCLRRHQLAQFFDDVCGTSRIFGKESRIRSMIKSSGIAASETLYVGDEIRDIEAANAAMVDVAAVGWGLNSRRALLKQNPTHFASEPSELIELINGRVQDPGTAPKAPQP